MGNCMNCSSCCQNRRPLKVYNVLLLGLSGAGKTEIGMRLSGKVREDFSSTNGVQGFKRYYKHDLINFTEIGGNEEMRKIWHHYYAKAMGVIYAIDITDPSTLSYSLEVLLQVLQHKYMTGKPVAVIATKADLSQEIDVIDINETFGVENIANHFQSHMLLQSMSDSNDLVEALAWLKNHIEQDYKNLCNRIQFDEQDARSRRTPILHHDEKKFIESARYAFHRVGALLVPRPYSAPPGIHRHQERTMLTLRARSRRNLSSKAFGNTRRVRFE